MKLLRAFFVQLRQALSWPLALCCILSAIMTELSVSGIIASGETFVSVWYLENMSGVRILTLFVLPTLSFAMSLSIDWESHTMPYWTVRTGVAMYTISKLLTAATTGFLTVGLGIALFVTVNGTFLPLYISCSSVDYEVLFEAGHTLLAWIAYILHMAMSGAIIGMLGMFTSILVPNRFVAISAPLAIHLTVLRIIPTHLISPTSIWHPINWVESIHYTASPWLTLLEKLMLTVGFCGMMCFVGCIAMKRRMENG